MKYSPGISIYLVPLLSLCLPLAGCTDEVQPSDRHSSETVAFTAAVSAVDARLSRAGHDLYDPLVLNSDDEDYPLYLHTYEHALGDDQEAAEASRGQQINSTEDLFNIHNSFDVRGDMEADGSPYIPMQNTRRSTTDPNKYNIWTTEHAQRWPGEEFLTFNAVAPHGHLSHLASAEYGKNSISFSYTALKGNGDNDAEQQTDLMMAVATMNRPGTRDYNYRVPLKFHHALSAIKFAVRDVLSGRIVKISIKGVKGAGDCVYTADDNSANGRFVWSNLSGNETYGQIFDHEIENGNFDPNDDTQDKILNVQMPEKTFMLIPQEIPEEATIEVTVERYNPAPNQPAIITVGGKIRANNVTEWLPGHEYVYTLSTSKDNWVYVFNALGNVAHDPRDIYVYSPGQDEFGTAGNSAYFSVQSYRYKANDQNDIEALPWKASHGGSLSYRIDGTTETAYPILNPQQKYVKNVDWITDTTTPDTPLSDKGLVDKAARQLHNLAFLPHYVSTTWPGDETMQGYPPYTGFTEASPYDLSTFGDTRPRTTANCYVIDRGGWYMFPLAYGNAIKDGAPNPGAYTCNKNYTAEIDNKKVLKTLKDYEDKDITRPYIPVSNTAAAQLIWQDAYNMIENVELVTLRTSVDNEQMIRFYVDPNNLQQGNAILALTDRTNGTVMWSWHIWATEHWLDKDTRLPHVYDHTNTNFTTFQRNERTGIRERGDVSVTYNQYGRTNMMAPYNLGWCDPKEVLYLKRKTDMDFVQYMPDGTTPTGYTDKLPVIQDGEIINYRYANNTYYQWGRKDPMRGYIDHEQQMKVVFGSKLPDIQPQKDITIGKATRNPNVFYGKIGDSKSPYQDWLADNNFINLWNNHSGIGYGTLDFNEDLAELWCHQKTVYDPSPAGYMVPNAGILRVIQKSHSTAWTDSEGNVYDGEPGYKDDKGNRYVDAARTILVTQKDKWAGGNWPLTVFRDKINGVFIDDFTYKVWGGNVGDDNNALFFSSTGNRWFTDDWKVDDIGAGGNFGLNVSYAWSSRYANEYNAYGMALGLDTNTVDYSHTEKRYFVGAQFVGRRAMGRPVRAIREP